MSCLRKVISGPRTNFQAPPVKKINQKSKKCFQQVFNNYHSYPKHYRTFPTDNSKYDSIFFREGNDFNEISTKSLVLEDFGAKSGNSAYPVHFGSSVWKNKSENRKSVSNKF